MLATIDPGTSVDQLSSQQIQELGVLETYRSSRARDASLLAGPQC